MNNLIWNAGMRHVVFAALCLGGLTACNDGDTSLLDVISTPATPNPPALGRIWGSSDAGFVDGDQTTSRFDNPVNVEVAPDGTVYVADFENNAIRAISTTGIVSTLVAQTASTGILPHFEHPFGLTIDTLDPVHFLYVQTDADDNGVRNATTGSTIWHVNRSTGAATVVARDLGKQRPIQTLSDGRIAMTDRVHQVISILNPATGSVALLAGVADTTGSNDNNIGSLAHFNTPYGLAVMSDGALLVADKGNHCLRRVTLAGAVTTFTGTCAPTVTGGSANGALATATFNGPQDVAINGTTIYVSDHDNHLIRRISGSNVATQAGDGMQGFIDAEGTAAEFYGLEGIALSPDGATLWMADGNNGDGSAHNRVRKLTVP